MSIKDLLIELDAVNDNLNRIANSSEYIEQRAREIFQGKSYGPDPAAIKAMIDEYTK